MDVFQAFFARCVSHGCIKPFTLEESTFFLEVLFLCLEGVGRPRQNLRLKCTITNIQIIFMEVCNEVHRKSICLHVQYCLCINLCAYYILRYKGHIGLQNDPLHSRPLQDIYTFLFCFQHYKSM